MKLNLINARQWLKLTLGRRQPVGDSQRRYVRIMQAVLSALAGKGVATIVSFIAVPLTVGYLGAERYGVWMTISSLLLWLQMADLGLGNGLTNVVSEAYAKGRADLAQVHVATAFWLLVVIVIITLGIGVLCWPWFDWTVLFNVQSAQARAETGSAMALAITISLLSLPLSIVPKIYGAYQESATANYWIAGGHVASFVALVLVTRTEGGLVFLIAAFSGTLLLISLANGVWLFGWHKPWLRPDIMAVRYRNIGQFVRLGGVFFILQLSSLFIFQTDNIIIARFLGASQVTPYSVTWRLFSYATLLQVLIFPALWPAYSEAFARSDMAWIQRTFRLNLFLSLASTCLLVLPLLIAGNTIIALWAGSEAVPPVALLFWMAGWSLIYASMSPVACLLNASGRVRGQMIYGGGTAIMNVVLSIVLIKPFGITGVIAATVISYLVCNVIPASLEMMFFMSAIPARRD